MYDPIYTTTASVEPDLRPTFTGANGLEMKLNPDGTSDITPPRDWRSRQPFFFMRERNMNPEFPKSKPKKRKKKQHKIYKKKGLSR